MSSSRDAGLSDGSALFGSFSRFQQLEPRSERRAAKQNGQTTQEEEQGIVPVEGTTAVASERKRSKRRHKSTRLALLDADNQDIGGDAEALADVSHKFTSLLLEPDAYGSRVGVIEVDGMVRATHILAPLTPG